MAGTGRSRIAVAVLGVAGTLLLAGCTGSSDAGGAAVTVPTIPTTASTTTTATAATSTAATTTAAAVSSAADPTGTAGGAGANGGTGGGGSNGTAATGTSTGGNSTRSASQGCTPDGTGVPSGTVSKRTIDVDGDGRADTEWIQTATASADGSVLLGITTASGATFGARFTSASPIPRSAFFADATGSGEIVALASDGRQANLFVVDGCHLVPATNAQGDPYTFDLGFGSYGTGIGCSQVAGTSGRELVGLKANLDASGQPTTVDRTAVEISGTRATNGPSDSVDVRGDAPSDPAVATAREITCGALTLSSDGVSQPSL